MSSLESRIATLPLPPARAFASDNAAGADPAVVQAIVAANDGHALAYGSDSWTAETSARFAELFGVPCTTALVWNGTGANVTALAACLQPAQSVICSEWAHIATDESGAPERIVGAKLQTVPGADAKVRPEQIEALAHLQESEHHAEPAMVSLTQSTELGKVYSPGEVTEICRVAHAHDMLVHIDGARIANATAALGGTVAALRAFTVDAGVDVISFGGTKNGMIGGEAVVFLRPELARRVPWVRKMCTQLPSKMRFIAAQFNALLDGGRWIRNAANANEMATRLYDAVRGIPGVAVDGAPEVNSVFACLPAELIKPLQEWCFFWDWDVARNQVRWMTSWDTTATDIDAFAAGVRHLCTA